MGYDPIRVDSKQTNDKIDDKIIADIRKSGLVVADFTEQKCGVYFEAGFALGISVTLIWTCRDTEIDRLHSTRGSITISSGRTRTTYGLNL